MEQLSTTPYEKLKRLFKSTLDNLQWLFFCLNMTGHWTGDDEVNLIFERLAARDEMFKGSMNHDPEKGVNLGPGDFIRNLLLGCFPSEAAGIQAYKELWLPVENAAGNTAAGLESFFESFLIAQGDRSNVGRKTRLQKFVQGSLYKRFRTWFNKYSESLETSDGPTCSTAALKKLLEFSATMSSGDPRKKLGGMLVQF